MKKKLYFFDKGIFNPYKMNNVKIYVNKVVKEGKVFFKEDYFDEENKREWEVRFDNSYPTVFYDEDIGKYRCYYSTFTTDEGSSEFDLESRKKCDYKPKTDRIVSLCYAESEDGVNWYKPVLNLTEFNGNKENNILGHYLHGTSILYDKVEKDQNKRYKLFTKIDYGNGIHYMAVAFSKDGLVFDKFIKLDRFNPRGDTYNHTYFDEDLNRYVLITREWRDSMRICCYSTSEDFINWEPVKEINLTRGYENQVYSMAVFKKGDYILGVASMFHEGDMSLEEYDKVDVELTYSYRHNGWSYVDEGNKFISRGQGDYSQGDFDCGCIYTTAPVDIGDKTYFYYIGGNGQHTNFREGSFSRGYIEKDRYAYVGMKDVSKEGVLYTNSFMFLSENVYFDMEIEKDGYVEVILRENNHSLVENIKAKFEKEGDKYRLVFDKDVKRKLLRLEIHMKNAKIYSVEGDIDVFRVESDGSLLRA